MKIKWPHLKSAVAWQAEKTEFLFKKEITVGVNQSITVSLVKKNQESVVRIEIPISKFNSDNELRDAKVIDILSGGEYPNLVFESACINEQQLMSYKAGGEKFVEGTMKIANKIYNVTFSIELLDIENEAYILCRLSTEFQALGVVPPRFIGGLVSKVENQLMLHARIFLKDLKFSD